MSGAVVTGADVALPHQAPEILPDAQAFTEVSAPPPTSVLPTQPAQARAGETRPWTGRKRRKPRPAQRRVLPPSDLGGGCAPPPDAEALAALASTLGPIATRRSPIRDAILACLGTPRRVADIAAHIGRPVPTATGHLAAMRRRGLVKRIGYATYALATYPGESLALGHRQSRSDRPLRRTLRALLVERRTLAELCQATSASPEAVTAALRELWYTGLVSGDRVRGYRLVAAIRNE